jgi:heme A synthase
MRLSRFARFAWTVLAYNLAVIVWGAYVRASGSGAGCGAHWPLCDGKIVPRPRSVEMAIELSHRVTSGVALVLVVVMCVWAFRVYPPGSSVRRGAMASVAFIIGEALVGAGLVLFALVAHDASIKRALSMSLHLTNTFFLLASMALTAWWATGFSGLLLRGQGAVRWLLGAALASMLVLGTSGAVAALGDTLFPARSLADGLAQDVSATAHVFLRLRLLHPFIATGAALLVLGAVAGARWLRPSPRVRMMSRLAAALFVVQYGAGLLNVTLLAPIPMQLVHLVLADLVWIALVLLAASALAADHPFLSKNRSAPASDVPPSTTSVAPVT